MSSPADLLIPLAIVAAVIMIGSGGGGQREEGPWREFGGGNWPGAGPGSSLSVSPATR